jgi:hypothetical protein
MSYTVNKTDGTVLSTVGDGTVDNTTTDITLVGRKFSGYGEVLNENFVKILESFANNTAPTNPIEGQIWYDTFEGRLKVYTGSVFKPTGGPLVQDSQPDGLVLGDLWINNEKNQLYFYDGVDLTLAGPIYSKQQGENGFVVETLTDTSNNGRVVSKLFVNGLLVGILSRYEFTPKTAINGFATVKVGLNLSTAVNGLKIHGSATSADAVAGIDPGQFLRSDENDITTGTLGIVNNGGVTLGTNSNFTQFIDGSQVTILKNNLQDRDFQVQINSSSTGGIVTALDIDSSALQLDVFEGETSSLTRVGGDLTVFGNLTVNGATTFIDSQNMRIEDKNIELSVTNTPTDDLANGGGITLQGNTNYTISWDKLTNHWDYNQGINLETGNTYTINDNLVLSDTTLGSGVINSSLTNVGVLTELQVDDIEINGDTISTVSSSGDLNFRIWGAGNIVLDPEESTPVTQIKGVKDPTANQDVATKNYVDTELRSKTLQFTINVSGASPSVNTYVEAQLAKLAPPVNYEVGTQARVLCETLSLTGAATPIQAYDDTDAGWLADTSQTNVILRSKVAVDKDGNLSSASTVQDVTIPNGFTPSGNSIAVSSEVRIYELDSSPAWVATGVVL